MKWFTALINIVSLILQYMRRSEQRDKREDLDDEVEAIKDNPELHLADKFGRMRDSADLPDSTDADKTNAGRDS